MSAYTDTLEAIFPNTYTGLAANTQYQITGQDGTVHQAFTATGVAEKATAPGTYYVRNVALDDTWLPIEVDWQIVGSSIGASDVLKNAPKVLNLSNVSVVVGSGVNAISSAASGIGVSAIPPRYDVAYPRGQQVSYVLYLSVPITGRTITWNLRTSETALTALLTKDNAGTGGITLNSGTVTVGTVVYAVNQVATLTILAADLANTTTFPDDRNFWHGFELNSPAEKPAWGQFNISTEP